MKVLLFILTGIVALFTAYFVYIQRTFLAGCLPTSSQLECMFVPTCDQFINPLPTCWSGAQKALVRHLLHLDFLFIVFYTAWLGFWSYFEMQRQPIYWINNLLRLNFFLIVVSAIADVIENFFLLQYLADFPMSCGFLSVLPTTIKWLGVAGVLLGLLLHGTQKAFYWLSSR